MITEDEIKKVNNCIASIKNGSDEAIVELYTSMGNTIRFIAIRYLKNKYDSEDAVQDFWLNIKKYCNKIWHINNGYKYLCKTMQNLCLIRLRKSRNSKEKLTITDIELFEKYGDDENLNIEQRTLKDIFKQAISKMNDLEKKVFYLWCYEEMSIREMGREINISKSTIHRIKANVEKIIRETLIENDWVM